MEQTMRKDEKELTPSEYFEMVKEKRQHVTDEALDQYYTNCLKLINKYQQTGQRMAARKLIFHTECIEKEREVIKLGINTYVAQDDIEEFIQEVSKKVVKLIQLEDYEREIPDDVVDKLEKVKHLFDRFYVVFTDYTGKVERKVNKERREKDPILFGTFQEEKSQTLVDRFYYIGDWEDEYCDLTLDKMVSVMKKERDKDIEMHISTPKDLQALKKQLDAIEEREGRLVMTNRPIKPSLLQKMTSWFKR